MEEDPDEAYWAKLVPVWRRILIGVVILLIVMGTVGGWWLLQIDHNRVVVVRTPIFIAEHPSARSPVEALTARALSAVPPVATATLTPTPTPIRGLGQWVLRSGLPGFRYVARRLVYR